MRTLVEDDPEQQEEEPSDNIDQQVKQKTVSFWEFILHLGGSVNNTRRKGMPKPLKQFIREIWTGKKKR